MQPNAASAVPVRVVGAVAIRDGRVLMARRPDGRHAGLWEFPGGKVEPGEDDATALQRELFEELAVRSVVGDLVATGSDDRVHLACYRVDLLADPVPLYHDRLAWVPIPDLGALPTPPADRAAVLALG
ncbi:MAG: (deoxy)nucleoside triphosphate pyrophosphohydrolase [Deltaproteobacteria bacterium]|nr:(deoxy)nucleoside triphosphate pyrophosphohydrolase [Deltaproteobacteria bacterium]